MRTSTGRFTPMLMLVIAAHSLCAKDKHARQPAAEPGDEIVVSGHVSAPPGVITAFVFSHDRNRRYVYAERDGQPPIPIDITGLDSPRVLSMLSDAGNARSGSLVAVAGTTAVVSDSGIRQNRPQPQTIRIINYSDPARPKITREFMNVTAIGNQNGVILLANPEGIWILSRKLAEDSELEAEYARHVLYQ